MKRMTAAFRCHWPFFMIVPILTIVMTWPTLAYVFDLNTLWLPSDDIDLRMKFWDAWYYGDMAFTGKADFYFTKHLFYPKGLSLAYHNFSIPHLLLMRAAQLVLPPTNAFNLSTLLVILANAAGCYVYVFYLLRDRWLGLFGSVIFALSVWVIVRPGQTSVYTVAAIPLALYCLQRGLAERRRRSIALAGALTGLMVFTGMYIYVCLLITLGVFILFQLPKRWKAREFWISMLIFSALAGSISALRVYPMMSDEAALNDALQKGGGQEYGSDLLDHFIHRENVLTEFVFASILREPVPPIREDGYLGYVVLLLAAIGLLSSRSRRRALFWLLLFLIFFTLKLGPYLIVNERAYTDIILPKHHLNTLFPTVFKAFWITAYFHVGMLLPLAMLAALGLRSLLAAIPARAGVVVVIACLALNLLETFEPPDSIIVPTQRLNYIDWLRDEGPQDEIRLINLPFGRAPSKHYALYHGFSGFAHAEGGASRMPSVAFLYIEENALLGAWQNDEGILCLPFNEDAFKQALDQLLADGFSHVVFHSDAIRGVRFANYSVMSALPAYQDDYVRVYRLADLRKSCRDEAFYVAGVLPQLSAFLNSSASAKSKNAFDAELPPLALAVAADGTALGAPVSLAKPTDSDHLLPDEGIALIAFYPAHSATGMVEAAAGSLANSLNSCGVRGEPGAARIEFFTRAEVPCALLFAEDPLAVRYENGVVLANILLKAEGDMLRTRLLWNKLPDKTHGVSIQAFDQTGAKAANSDFTIRHHSLSDHRLDLGALAPGVYDIKLILYNFGSGKSVPGIVIESQRPIQRELDIGRVTID